MKKISEGAEADIYTSEFMGIPAIIKDRVKKDYRTPKLDEEIRTQRTKLEARILSLASEHRINVPSVMMLGKYQIYMSKIDGSAINVIINEKKKIDLSKAFVEAGKNLASLHELNISHGDYTPANLILDKEKVWVIDFGLGEIKEDIENKALDVLLMKRSISKELYKHFLAGYAKYKESKLVLERLEEIEKRGRYQTRTMLTG